MKGSKKKIVSLRLDETDLTRVRDISRRLRSREADVFRFALRLGLARMAPLHDANVRGADLLPAFIDHGPDLAIHFNLDVERLQRLFNAGLEDDTVAVERGDLELIALSATPETYLFAKLHRALGKPVNRANTLELLREYLVGKYLEGPAGPETKEGASVTET
ncbi:MAG: hypothetical protein VX663_11060 [Pseudomonadota bacterium]|nr:hypothetical protein [Pseudomonadota bacterium]